MPYCNACGKYIPEGMLCGYCARVAPDDAYPIPDPAEGTAPTGAESEPDIAAAAILTADPVFDAPAADPEEAARADSPAPSVPEAEAPTGAPDSSAPSEDAGSPDPAPGINTTLRRAYARVLDTPDTTDRYSPRDVREHRKMAVLSYLGLLWIIPFFCARTSRFVKFHLGQGLLLLLTDGIGATLLGVALLLFGFAPAVAPAVAAISEVLLFVSLALKIFGVVSALRGRAKELPLVGSCAETV